MQHELYELKQKQSLPLQAKIVMSQRRIIEWYEAWNGEVSVSCSFGKDSTVLLHLVRSIYPNVPAVFVDTGLEYPEVRKCAYEAENVIILKPEMTFRKVIETYGYPVVSKDIAKTVYYARKGSAWAQNKMKGINNDGTPSRWRETHYCHWQYLLDAPFKISNFCCDVMKKKPVHKYEKETGHKFFIGTMADESIQRQQAWLQTGCNAFDAVKPISKPLSFWLETDILEYIRLYDLKIPSCYGDIVKDGNGKLTTTGVHRTGCMFCMFGAQCEKAPNRFERMAHTHTRNSMNTVCGLLKKKGLGLMMC